jgi:ABC-2 type transport system permease protein
MAANAVLRPVKAGGWRGGFSNLFRKEMGLWWATKRWWKTSLLWLLVLNGLLLIVIFSAKTEPDAGNAPLLPLASQVFFQVASMATAIAATIMTQDAIIGEKQLGTAAWILSKPASREAFVLAKVVAHAIGMVILAGVVRALVFLPEVKYTIGAMPSLLPFAAGVGLLALNVLFYQALAFMLGTCFQVRGGVIGIGLGFLFAGELVPSFAPWMQYVTPWGLGGMAGGYVAGTPLPAWALAPIAATAVLIPALLAVSLWRFNREEL